MKKKALLILTFVFAIACLFAVAVSAVEIGGINYTLTKGVDGADNTANVNSHKGKTLSVTEIVISEYVEYEGEKYYITSMSSSAFEGTNITSVVFADNSRVTVVPQWGFKGCSNLTYVKLHDGITKISANAFEGDSKMRLASGILPSSLTSDIGGSAFKGCTSLGQSVLVFPAGMTEFLNDTGLQGAGVKTLVFQGKMTKVRLQYYGGLTVYFAANSVNDLNGNYVASHLGNGVPYYTVAPAEKINGKNYTEKTNGTLTITAFSGNNNNSSGGTKTDANGNKIAPVNKNQDRLFFCNEDKVVFLIRNSAIAGNWSSYIAVYDTVEGDTTYKRDPHLKGEGEYLEGSCYLSYCCMACGCEMEKVLSPDALGHIGGEIIDMDYTNGYFARPTVKYNCEKCGIEYNGGEAGDALFVHMGYSVSTFGTSLSITQGFKINKSAVEAYKTVSPSFDFGAMAMVNQTNGEITPSLDNALVLEFDKNVNDYVDIKLTGITEEHISTRFVFCIYVIDGEVLCFLDGSKSGTSVMGKSYNEILAESVA